MALLARLTLDELPAGLLCRVVDHLRGLEPAAIGVLVTRSYAAGRASPQSDVDVMVLTPVPARGGYRTWFEPHADILLHVSAGAEVPDAWVEEGRTAAGRALGFPTEEVVIRAWATEAARAESGDPPVMRRPPGSPELEDFLECATKVKRAAAAEDDIGVRWHAQHLSRYAARLLRPLNPERHVTTVRDALQSALDLPTGPASYRDDVELCLGLRPVDDRAVAAAVQRMATGLLAFLRERRLTVDSQPDPAQYLADGTLERHLADV